MVVIIINQSDVFQVRQRALSVWNRCVSLFIRLLRAERRRCCVSEEIKPTVKGQRLALYIRVAARQVPQTLGREMPVLVANACTL